MSYDELAKEEIQELVNQYVCNDYKFGGKFNNPIFKLKEKKIDLLVEKELQKHPEVQKDLIIDVFIIDTKKRLFQEIYKINWNPKVIKDAKEFEKKYYEIIKKYDVSDCYDIKDFL